jgi:hypothetical protein
MEERHNNATARAMPTKVPASVAPHARRMSGHLFHHSQAHLLNTYQANGYRLRTLPSSLEMN